MAKGAHMGLATLLAALCLTAWLNVQFSGRRADGGGHAVLNLTQTTGPTPSSELTSAISPPPTSPTRETTSAPHVVWNVTRNAGQACQFVFDSADGATITPSLSEAQLDKCGGPVSRRSEVLTPAEAAVDVALGCNDWTRHNAAFHFGRTGYLDAVTQLHGVIAPRDVLQISTGDAGCFTTSRAPRGSYFVNTGLSMPLASLGLAPDSGQLIDMATSYFTYNAVIGEAKPDHCKALDKLWRWWRRALEGGVDKGGVDKGSAAVVPDIPGDAVVLVIRHEDPFHALQLEQMIDAVSRAFAVGLMDGRNVTFVATRGKHEVDQELRAWVEPWVAPHRFVWVNASAAVRLERAWYLPSDLFEPLPGCTGHFLRRWLLPRVLAAVRTDSTFTSAYCTAKVNGSTRAEVTDNEQWAAQAFPRKLFFVKRQAQTRTTNSVFELPEDLLATIRSLGFTIIGSETPLHYRLALINFAEVVVTPYGSMTSLMAMLHRGGRSGSTAASPLPRFIVLMHPRYNFERMWAVTGASRYGLQHGLEVFVTDTFSYAVPGSWSKVIIFLDAKLSAATLQPSHLTFEAADCTLNATQAKDFASVLVAADPRSHKVRRMWRRVPRWHDLPRLGRRCQQFPPPPPKPSPPSP